MRSILLAMLFLALAHPIASAAGPDRADRASRRALAAIRERARVAPAGTVRLYEPRIDELGAEVDLAAMRQEALVASRLAVEFGLEARSLMRERARVASRWSELMIARTLDANARRPISLEQILGLRRDGLAWTRIAVGLGLRPVQFASAVRAEARAAIGLEAPDGRVHVIGPLEPDTRVASAPVAGS